FMVMGYVFCLSTAFALAKFVRDNQQRHVDTPMWKLVVWGGFLLAMALTGWGLWRMSIQPVWKAYLLVCWLFLISTVFTLAKTLTGWKRAWPAAARASTAPPPDPAASPCLSHRTGADHELLPAVCQALARRCARPRHALHRRAAGARAPRSLVRVERPVDAA